MRILGKMQKKRVVTKCVRPVTRLVCDKCGKELKGLYAWVTTSHNLWGHDSVESVHSHDYCFECARKAFEEYTEHPERTEEFEYEARNAEWEDKEVEVLGDGDLYMDDYSSCRIEEE